MSEERLGRRPPRPRPVTIAEHKAEALRCLEMSFGGLMDPDDMMRRARRHIQAARMPGRHRSDRGRVVVTELDLDRIEAQHRFRTSYGTEMDDICQFCWPTSIDGEKTNHDCEVLALVAEIRRLRMELRSS